MDVDFRRCGRHELPRLINLNLAYQKEAAAVLEPGERCMSFPDCRRHETYCLTGKATFSQQNQQLNLAGGCNAINPRDFVVRGSCSTPTAPTILNRHCFRALKRSMISWEKPSLHRYCANGAGFVRVSFFAPTNDAHNAAIFSFTLNGVLHFCEGFTNVVLRDNSIALIHACCLMS